MDNGDITRLGYRELAVRYDLGTLQHGAGLHLTASGDLKMTRDGDLQIGDDVHNALHRLVVRWRFNVRELKTLFDFVFEARTKKSEYERERDEIAPLVMTDKAANARFNEIRDELGSLEYGPEAYAGTIMVVLSALLRREYEDLGKPSNWNTAGTLIGGQSFAAIVEAAANNFRHFDEWAATLNANPQQMKSMSILASLLGRPLDPSGVRHRMRDNVCPGILVVLTNGNFETLMDGFFNCARSLAGLK